MPDLNKVAGFEIAKLSTSHDLAFRVRNRRNRLMGLWAASRLALDEAGAEAYAREMVAVGVQHVADDALVDRLRNDFAQHGIDMPDATIRSELERLTGIATLEHGSPRPETRPAA